jgi:hypothetical protein
MGGFVALQCGLLLEADAAISVGGRFAWHPPRLLREPAETVQGFDPLCACYLNTPTDLVCYHSANQVDVEDATLLASVMPVRRIAMPETSEHNILLVLRDKGLLENFYDRVFEFSGAKPARLPLGTQRPASLASHLEPL